MCGRGGIRVYSASIAHVKHILHIKTRPADIRTSRRHMTRVKKGKVKPRFIEIAFYIYTHISKIFA